MKTQLPSQAWLYFVLVLFFFFQPNIHCKNKAKDNPAGYQGGNPIFKKPTDAGIWQPPSAPNEVLASEVKRKPGTSEVGEDDMRFLEKADVSSGEYVFSSSASDVARLQPGSFVFFRNHSVRKIVSVEKRDGKIFIQTGKCNFTDVFSDAHLHFKEYYNWKDNSRAILRSFGISFGEMIYAQGSGSNVSQNLSWAGTLRGYQIKIELKPEGGRKLNFNINMRRESKANITFKGFVSDYTNETEVMVAGSELQLFRSQNQNLQGEVEVQFAAVELGEEGEMINIPWTMFERPVLIGGIPFIFKTKANVKVFPFIGQGAGSQGHFKFTYRSDIGFRYEGRRVSAEGNVAGQTMEIIGETLSASMMGSGIGMGVEFPRFEIASLGEVVVPYFLMNTAVDTQVDTYRPCQMGNMKCKLVAGLNLNFFGASYAFERELWKGKKRWTREGSNCPPEED
jgi:hypothetical protein